MHRPGSSIAHCQSTRRADAQVALPILVDRLHVRVRQLEDGRDLASVGIELERLLRERLARRARNDIPS